MPYIYVVHQHHMLLCICICITYTCIVMHRRICMYTDYTICYYIISICMCVQSHMCLVPSTHLYFAFKAPYSSTVKQVLVNLYPLLVVIIHSTRWFMLSTIRFIHRVLVTTGGLPRTREIIQSIRCKYTQYSWIYALNLLFIHSDPA